MKTKLYIVRLEGQGDIDIRVVDASNWNWIHEPEPEFVGSSWEERVPGTDNRVIVTSGSYDNDRAIHCASIKDGFDTTKAAKDYIKSLDASFGGIYRGSIY